jgi:salicylate hydroxylase
VGAVWCGPDNHAVMYWISSGSVLNFVGCPARNAWEEESWTLKRPWTEMKADFTGWHSTMQTIIDAADHEQCFRWALNVRAPLSNWSTARATLLGDAAHPTLPFLAQGAAMAVEDGAVLARALEGTASLSEGIQLYQRNRIDRTARVVNESNKVGGLYRIVDAEEMRRAFAESNPAKDRAQWLFNYDPLTVPLQ